MFCSQGLECCSTYAITIHYVVHYQMFLFDFLLYQMHPYGIITGHDQFNFDAPNYFNAAT